MFVFEGNYNDLVINDKAFYLLMEEIGFNVKFYFKVVKIMNEDVKLVDMVLEISGFELS